MDLSMFNDLAKALVALAERGRPSRLEEMTLYGFEDDSVDQLTPAFEAGALPCLRSLVVTGSTYPDIRGELWDTWGALGPKIKLERLVVPSTYASTYGGPIKFPERALEDPDFCPFLREIWREEDEPPDGYQLLDLHTRMRKRELRAAKASVMDAMARLEACNAALEGRVADLEAELRALQGLGAQQG